MFWKGLLVSLPWLRNLLEQHVGNGEQVIMGRDHFLDSSGHFSLLEEIKKLFKSLRAL